MDDLETVLHDRLAAEERAWGPWRTTLIGSHAMALIAVRRIAVDIAAALPDRVRRPLLRWATTWTRTQPPEESR